MTRPAAGLRALQQIPGVGPRIAADLLDLGYTTPRALKRASPERMYARLCALRGQHIDRCMLYVFRCAVYYATTPRPDPERLKWWNWKDGGTALKPHKESRQVRRGNRPSVAHSAAPSRRARRARPR